MIPTTPANDRREEPTRPGGQLNGFLRLRQIVGPGGLVPVSRSAWYAGIKAGVYPPGIHIGRRSVAWRRADIDELLARMSAGDFEPSPVAARPLPTK